MPDPSGQAPRLPLVDPDTAPPAVKEALALLPAINLFRAMANATSLYPDYIRYVNLLFKPLGLDSGVERMVVLHVARQSGCLYAWRQNVVVARSVGVSDEQIAALEDGATAAPCFDERQQAAFRFTDEAMQLIEVTDATYAETKRHFEDRAITELLYVIGTYMFISRLARTGRVKLDDKPAAAPPTS